MSYTISYKNSPAPAFDAVEDIREYLGNNRYGELTHILKDVKSCANFALYCSMCGIRGYPVQAWYELINGQGSWKPEELENV